MPGMAASIAGPVAMVVSSSVMLVLGLRHFHHIHPGAATVATVVSISVMFLGSHRGHAGFHFCHVRPWAAAVAIVVSISVMLELGLHSGHGFVHFRHARSRATVATVVAISGILVLGLQWPRLCPFPAYSL